MTDLIEKIRVEWHLIFRGIKIIQNMMPTYIFYMFSTAIVTSIRPYINLYFSALIIDNIVAQSSLSSIFKSVALFIGSDFLLRVMYQLLFAKVRINELIFDSWEESYLNKKSFNLSFSNMENAAIRLMRQKIIDNRELGGLRVLLQRILWLFRAGLSLIIAICTLPRMFKFSSIDSGNVLLNWVNTPYAVITFIIILLLGLIFIVRNNYKVRSKQYDLTEELSMTQRISHFYIDEYFDDSKSGKDIRLYALDELILSSIKDAFSSYLTQYKKVMYQKKRGSEKEQSISTFLSGLVYVFAGLKTLSGALTPGSLIEFSGVIKNLIQAIINIVSIIGALRSNNSYLKDLYKYLDLDEGKEGSKKKTVSKLEQFNEIELRIDDLWFKYPESNKYTLKNINLNIKSGEKIAVVGKNGSGKTTFVKVLCGLYNPTKGKIFFNNIEKTDLDDTKYNDLFAVVFQDFNLFSVSLAQNISAGIDYDENKIRSAIVNAGLKQRVAEMPNDIDTIIFKDFDKSGIEVSGGESQKIAIARAFYKDSPIFIFDEPTAALDPMSEYEIYSNLMEKTENRTTIFVSHRLSSCRFCDRILVFNDGEIVQNGKHDELLSESNGLYYQLWNAQAQHYVEVEK